MQLTKVNFWNKWMRNGRRPAKPVTRFKADKPMVLRNSVTSGTRVDSDVVCIPQMMDMLSCFKDNDYDQSKCGQFINAFQSCYDKYVSDRKAMKSEKEDTGAAPGATKLTKNQVNVLLARWPQPS